MMIIFDNHKEFYEEREKCADQDIVYAFSFSLSTYMILEGK